MGAAVPRAVARLEQVEAGLAAAAFIGRLALQGVAVNSLFTLARF